MQFDILLQPAIPAAFIGVFSKYALDRFDGFRKTRQDMKELAVVCWHGPLRRPLNLPRWVAQVITTTKNYFQRNRKQTSHTSTTRNAIVFIFNRGQTPLTSDDLFKSKPLKLRLSGNGELLDVKIRHESDHTAGIKISGHRTIFRSSPNHLTERSITFSYIGPRHGVVLDIKYRAETLCNFSISGPIKGMKDEIQQQILFDVNLADSRHPQRQRRTDTRKLWLGGLMMASAAIYMIFDASMGGHVISSRNLAYWLDVGVTATGEWIAISAWYRLKQPKKVPAALRYWEPTRNPLSHFVVK